MASQISACKGLGNGKADADKRRRTDALGASLAINRELGKGDLRGKVHLPLLPIRAFVLEPTVQVGTRRVNQVSCLKQAYTP